MRTERGKGRSRRRREAGATGLPQRRYVPRQPCTVRPTARPDPWSSRGSAHCSAPRHSAAGRRAVSPHLPAGLPQHRMQYVDDARTATRSAPRAIPSHDIAVGRMNLGERVAGRHGFGSSGRIFQIIHSRFGPRIHTHGVQHPFIDGELPIIYFYVVLSFDINTTFSSSSWTDSRVARGQAWKTATRCTVHVDAEGSRRAAANGQGSIRRLPATRDGGIARW